MFQTFVLKISAKQKIRLRFGMTNSINKHWRLKIPYTYNTNFKPIIIIYCARHSKSESKINIFITDPDFYWINQENCYPLLVEHFKLT